MSWEKYRRWIEQVEQTDAYQAAGLETEFTEELCRVMEEQGVSRAELARRAGTSPAYITKILRGGTNFTLATMAKLARALGMEVRLHLAPVGTRTLWRDVPLAQGSYEQVRWDEQVTRSGGGPRAKASLLAGDETLGKPLARDPAFLLAA